MLSRPTSFEEWRKRQPTDVVDLPGAPPFVMQLHDVDQKRYDPNQPRDPKGTPTGGRWTSEHARPFSEPSRTRDNHELLSPSEVQRRFQRIQRGQITTNFQQAAWINADGSLVSNTGGHKQDAEVAVDSYGRGDELGLFMRATGVVRVVQTDRGTGVQLAGPLTSAQGKTIEDWTVTHPQQQFTYDLYDQTGRLQVSGEGYHNFVNDYKRIYVRRQLRSAAEIDAENRAAAMREAAQVRRELAAFRKKYPSKRFIPPKGGRWTSEHAQPTFDPKKVYVPGADTLYAGKDRNVLIAPDGREINNLLMAERDPEVGIDASELEHNWLAAELGYQGINGFYRAGGVRAARRGHDLAVEWRGVPLTEADTQVSEAATRAVIAWLKEEWQDGDQVFMDVTGNDLNRHAGHTAVELRALDQGKPDPVSFHSVSAAVRYIMETRAAATAVDHARPRATTAEAQRHARARAALKVRVHDGGVDIPNFEAQLVQLQQDHAAGSQPDRVRAYAFQRETQANTFVNAASLAGFDRYDTATPIPAAGGFLVPHFPSYDHQVDELKTLAQQHGAAGAIVEPVTPPLDFQATLRAFVPKASEAQVQTWMGLHPGMGDPEQELRFRALVSRLLGGNVFWGDTIIDPHQTAQTNQLIQQLGGETQALRFLAVTAELQRDAMRRRLEETGQTVPDHVEVFRGVVYKKAVAGHLREHEVVRYEPPAVMSGSLVPVHAVLFAHGWSTASLRAGHVVDPELLADERGVVYQLNVPWHRVLGSFIGGVGSPDVSEALVLGDLQDLEGQVVATYDGPLSLPGLVSAETAQMEIHPQARVPGQTPPRRTT